MFDAYKMFDKAGSLTDEASRQLIQKLMAALVQLVLVSPAGKGPAA